MTTVYGVTKYGARQQIRGQLESIEDFPQKHTWEASFYLTDKTFKCLQQMFTSTKAIQVHVYIAPRHHMTFPISVLEPASFNPFVSEFFLIHRMRRWVWVF